ncbi:CpaF family protein, partial [Oceanicola sp. S124]|uniref:CpaF family protein n=1 Tax=Oceanicola sp. S124 TaxID=1042378 RepID=UPI0002559720
MSPEAAPATVSGSAPAPDFGALRRAVAAQLAEMPQPVTGADAYTVSAAIDRVAAQQGRPIPPDLQRRLMQELTPTAPRSAQPAALPSAMSPPGAPPMTPSTVSARDMPVSFTRRLNALSREILPEAMALLDFRALADLDPQAQRNTIRDAVLDVSKSQRLDLNGAESAELVGYVIDDMMGFGPLERLLADDGISDIMVNGPRQVYVERGGRLSLTDISFRDDQHVINIATRIVSLAGRRVDESSPLVDARLPDGSRINVTIPPLALDGPTMTIRKFPKDNLALGDLVERNSLSPRMADLLRVAARLRLNILISGGTGSGKTTLLNAISREIPETERIVTIEDAAELRLQQPHVVRLETRPPTIEGLGEVTMRHLFRNALRMRPDRIIIGEVRSDEALDLL